MRAHQLDYTMPIKGHIHQMDRGMMQMTNNNGNIDNPGNDKKIGT